MQLSSLFRRRYTEPGAPPDALNPPSVFVEPRLHRIVYTAADVREDDPARFDDLDDPDAGATAWIDCQGLGDGAVARACGARFGFHELAIADAVNVGQRPKVDSYEDTLFVSLRMVRHHDQDGLTWEQVSMFVRDGLVVTFQEKPGDCLDGVRERLRKGRRRLRNGGADYLATQLIDAIVDGYFPVLESFGDELEGLEESVLTQPGRDDLMELYAIRRNLLALRRSVWPLRDALSQALREEEGPLGVEARRHLRDTTDHVMQVVDILESYRELTTSLVDVYLSALGHRTNEVMRVLAVVGAIFLPLTFLAGIYGMNFDTTRPGNLPELGWNYGYALFWGVSALITTVLLLLFHRLGWLRSR